MTQDKIKENFSKNLIALRKSRNLTQLALAEKLNYSDKAVSKWEVGTVLPDVETMSNIADFFGVTVNDLIYEKKKKLEMKFLQNNVFIISAAAFAVFFLASIVFIVLSAGFKVERSWLAFIVAIPISSVVVLVLSSIWFGKKWLYGSVTALFWGILLNIYLFINNFGLWFIFIAGVIGQILITFSFMIKKFKKR